MVLGCTWSAHVLSDSVQGFRPVEHRSQLAKLALRYAGEHPPERLQDSPLKGIPNLGAASLMPAVLAVVILIPTWNEQKGGQFSESIFLTPTAVSKQTWHPSVIVAAWTEIWISSETLTLASGQHSSSLQTLMIRNASSWKPSASSRVTASS